MLSDVLLVSQATEYIFKYIIQSRRLFALATGGQNEEEFRCCMHELFMSIRFFLSQENKSSRPIAQTQVRDHWHGLHLDIFRSYSPSPYSCVYHIKRLVFSERHSAGGSLFWSIERLIWLVLHLQRPTRQRDITGPSAGESAALGFDLPEKCS